MNEAILASHSVQLKSILINNFHFCFRKFYLIQIDKLLIFNVTALCFKTVTKQ